MTIALILIFLISTTALYFIIRKLQIRNERKKTIDKIKTIKKYKEAKQRQNENTREFINKLKELDEINKKENKDS